MSLSMKNHAVETLEVRIANLVELEAVKAITLADVEADLKATREALADCRAAVEKIDRAEATEPTKVSKQKA